MPVRWSVTCPSEDKRAGARWLGKLCPRVQCKWWGQQRTRSSTDLGITSHELEQRIHCTQTCPTTAPNGSTLIVYGHDRGLRLLWRGGRRPKEPAQSQPNGTSSQDPLNMNAAGEEVPSDETMFEENEDEYDPDCPYPSIIQDVNVDLGAAVLELAIPTLPPFPYTPRLLRENTLVLVTCADGSSSIVVLALSPPSDVDKADFVVTIMPLESKTQPIRRYITAKIFGVDIDESAPIRTREDGEFVYGTLFVATATDHVRVSKLDILEGRLAIAPDSNVGIWTLPMSATGIEFHPSPNAYNLLISDRSGSSRVLDPLGSAATLRTLSTQDTSSSIATPSDASVGKWIVAFSAPYFNDRPGSVRRKQILAARWALNGRVILALLEDGEWGLWDVVGSVHHGKDLGEFVLHGFVGPTTSSESTSLQNKSSSKLAPMTPNTRKTKAENLFAGPSKMPGTAPHGGISIATSGNRGSQLDEHVLMWHNNEVYTIQSLLTFWQRSTSSDSTGFGTLHSPGLIHINDINLMNESITSLAQLAVKSSPANFGRLNSQRDFVISTEHRIIISQSLLPSTSARTLFQQPEGMPVSRDNDLKMLEHGDLDIGGMDRLLDSMANAEARPRKVGFVH
nr:nucleoporin nup37 [Quercus suber]